MVTVLNILDQIKASEQQAADIRSKASSQARDILREADRRGQDEAAKIVEDARLKGEALKEKADAESKQSAAAYVEQEAGKDAARLTKLTPKTDTAVQHIVEGVLHL